MQSSNYLALMVSKTTSTLKFVCFLNEEMCLLSLSNMFDREKGDIFMIFIICNSVKFQFNRIGTFFLTKLFDTPVTLNMVKVPERGMNR